MKSQYLQDMVAAEAIPEWVAERLDQLSSEDLKERAAGQLRSTIDEAVDALCDRLEHPAMAPQAGGNGTNGASSVTPKISGSSDFTVMRWIRESPGKRWGLIMSLLWLAPPAGIFLYRAALWPYRLMTSHEQRQQQKAANQDGRSPEHRLTGESASGSLFKKEARQSPPHRLAALTAGQQPAIRAVPPPSQGGRDDVPAGRLPGEPPLPASPPSRVSLFTQTFLKNVGGAVPAAVGQRVAALKTAAVSSAASFIELPNGDVINPATYHPSMTRPPAPLNLDARVIGHTVRLTWEDMGGYYRFNVHAAYTMVDPIFDIESDKPLPGPPLLWTPPAPGPQEYEIYITAVEPDSNESWASNHVFVKVR